MGHILARHFSVFALSSALLGGASAHAQVAAAAAAGVTAAAPHLIAAAPAILTSAVSSGSAHVGQTVLAKLASPSALSNGLKLPAGTQLLGHVTQAVPARGKSGKSELGMIFDHFKGQNGQTMPLDASRLVSLGSGSGGGEQTSANASTQANTDSGGGLLGGVTGAVGSTVNGVGNAVTGLVGTVTSLPGVLLDSTGTLVAQGRNVQVPAGTQVSLAASAQAGAN